MNAIELWFWELKEELTGKWRRTTWRMTEEDARIRHGDDARKIEGTPEVRRCSGPDDNHMSHLQPARKEK